MPRRRGAPLAVFFSLMILSGCITPPPKVDPYAELMIEAGPDQVIVKTFPRTKLALLHSKNTIGTRKYLKDFTRSGLALFRQNYFPGAKFDVDRVFSNFRKVLEKHFETVQRIDVFSDAAASGARLVAMLDITAEIAPPPGSKISTFEAKIIFLTLDKRRVTVMGGKNEQNVGNRGKTKIPEAAAVVLGEIDRELNASKTLARFDDPRGLASQIAAAPAPARRTYHSDVDTPGYKLPETRNDFALVIGIEDYANIPDAQFAERDAQAVRAHLVALGFPRRNIIYLTGQKAGKSGIDKYLREWLPRNVRKDSRVFVYFSGHGAPEPGTGQAYLMPWDADAKYLATTGYSLKMFYERLNRLKAKQIVVMIDSCFSGAGGRSVIAKGLRPLVTKVDTSASSAKKLVIFSASGADEVTGALEEQGHGLFTYHFLKGLQAKKGETTLQDLFDYLKPRVEEDARRDNRDQTPGLIPAVSDARTAALLR